eukprot:TRINITY_DN5247_c0_g1_i1.p1 TRINITY_DN5247_c0_g1~~TRINITY_DN5247_c0_g1_i1.p1  ORF type:complete len:293 (+),score=118.80 TRINITY_DN5247_c0_g1_i1:886-1764(+)
MEDDYTSAVLELLSKHPDGLADSEFDKLLELSREDKKEVLNELLAKGRVTLLETRGGELAYRYQSKERAEKYKELTANEIPIYQLLEESGDHGLSSKEIKDKTGITTVKINKILGSMENKGLIKVFKSIQGKKKKVYMLSEIEPSVEITGGIWYTELEFNKKLIDALCEKCMSFIDRKGTATRKEMTLYIRTLGILPGDIKEEEVQSIINILHFDNRIEPVKATLERMDEAASKGREAFGKAYRVRKVYEPEVALLSVPCSYCPLVKECQPDGVVAPSTCAYFKEWLDKSKV